MILFLARRHRHISRNVIARECSLKEHSLTEVGREVDEHPTSVLDNLDVKKLCTLLFNLLLDDLERSLLRALWRITLAGRAAFKLGNLHTKVGQLTR